MYSFHLISILLFSIPSIFSQCRDDLEEDPDLSPWTNMNGINYVSQVRDQGLTGMCWDFATTAFIETIYNIETQNQYKLSVEQIADNIYEFYQDGNNTNKFRTDPIFSYCHDVINPRTAFFGGIAYCALFYVSKSGIMTEYAYPFTQGGKKNIYNVNLVTPIGVKNIVGYTSDELSAKNFTLFNNLLYYGPVLTSVDASNWGGSHFISDIKAGTPNHAVLITGLFKYPVDGEWYLEFLNSWGIGWGCQGYGYIKISSGPYAYNNRGIMNEWISGEVYDRYVNGESFNIDKEVLITLVNYMNISTPCNETIIKMTSSFNENRLWILSLSAFIVIFVCLMIFMIIMVKCKTIEKVPVPSKEVELEKPMQKIIVQNVDIDPFKVDERTIQQNMK